VNPHATRRRGSQRAASTSRAVVLGRDLRLTLPRDIHLLLERAAAARGASPSQLAERVVASWLQGVAAGAVAAELASVATGMQVYRG
jgi:hypothetical protein